MTDILVVGDTTDGKLGSATAELIRAAGNLVGDVGVGLAGSRLQEAVREMKRLVQNPRREPLFG